MERNKLIEKLIKKTNVSSENARDALERSNWDILDAMVYLEDIGMIEKPSVSIFYTNKARYNDENREIINVETSKYERRNNFDGIFERICALIDTCNNIIIMMKKKDKVLLNIPLTALLILLFFIFWAVIPLFIVALFFDIDFYVYSKKVNTDKINRVLKYTSDKVKVIKEKVKRSSKNG